MSGLPLSRNLSTVPQKRWSSADLRTNEFDESAAASHQWGETITFTGMATIEGSAKSSPVTHEGRYHIGSVYGFPDLGDEENFRKQLPTGLEARGTWAMRHIRTDSD